tara:strand:+ start:437 stop:721 length:285 start_codon:yes stop_codon:yes gene_type:complete
VANEEIWDKDFNWFDEGHYERFEMVAGSREALLTAFHELMLIKWPNRKFGTRVEKIWQEGNEWKAKVSRFKTIDLCKKHCEFPPTYIRTGVVLP